MSSSLLDSIERARERFQRDVADQLRMAAEKTGLAASVTLDGRRAVLEFDEALSDGTLPRMIAAFDDAGEGEPGVDRMTLWVGTGEEPKMVLTLVWRDAPGLDQEAAWRHRLAELEARTDVSVPLERRGLNAPADVRTGPYGRGDVMRQLVADFEYAAPRSRPRLERSHALVPIEPPRLGVVRGPGTGGDFEDRAPRLAARPQPAGDADARRAVAATAHADIEAQRARASEFLIARLVQALQHEFTEAESDLVGPGLAASARARFVRAMDWAMLGTAYGVEAKTNQMAVASFLGNEGASWLYGMVGPVLIGGLAVLSKSRLGKGAAYGLMLSWALAMATITASDKGHLDRAQAYFPNQAEVLILEQTLAAARLAKEAAEAELKRLNAPAKDASELLAEAEARWQAAEIKRAAEREAALREKDRAKARHTVIEAGVALSAVELRLREANMNDPSRARAWWTLFAIFGLINLAGPLAISRVLEQWRTAHAEAHASARERHRMKSVTALLRGSRSAQKARAMLLLPALLDGLKRDGIPPEVIARLDLGDISQKAADRFARGISERAPRRSFILRRSADRAEPG